MNLSGNRKTFHELTLRMDDETYEVLLDFLKQVKYDDLKAIYDKRTSTPEEYAQPLISVLGSIKTTMMVGGYEVND